MKVKSLAPWFGGKRNLANHIINALGDHCVYWEPFCGSMAVLLSKEPCRTETVNDLHGDLINLARVLQGEETAYRLYERMNRTLFCDELQRDANARIRLADPPSNGEVDVIRAYDYLIISWMGRNGFSGTGIANNNFCVCYTSNGGHAAKRWRSVTESIPGWHKRLSCVTILKKDGFGLLERIEDKTNTAIYVDPPYLIKSEKYIHDFQDTDHDRLAAMLHRFRKTRVVVSYYDNPRLDKLYPNWQRVTFDVVKSTAGVDHKKRATEVLLLNQEQGLFPNA